MRIEKRINGSVWRIGWGAKKGNGCIILLILDVSMVSEQIEKGFLDPSIGRKLSVAGSVGVAGMMNGITVRSLRRRTWTAGERIF